MHAGRPSIRRSQPRRCDAKTSCWHGRSRSPKTTKRPSRCRRPTSAVPSRDRAASRRPLCGGGCGILASAICLRTWRSASARSAVTARSTTIAGTKCSTTTSTANTRTARRICRLNTTRSAASNSARSTSANRRCAGCSIRRKSTFSSTPAFTECARRWTSTAHTSRARAPKRGRTWRGSAITTTWTCASSRPTASASSPAGTRAGTTTARRCSSVTTRAKRRAARRFSSRC